MENSTMRETELKSFQRESLKGRKISLNPSSFGSAQMGAKHELPPLDTLRVKCDRIGHLKKLCGRGLLSAGTWKDRTCVLYHNQLFLYEKQIMENEAEKGRSTGIVLDLGQLDTVTEAPTRVTRKAANVFLLGTSEKGFFDTASNRHYFAAKSLSEMKDWVSVLRSCIESERRRKEFQNSTTSQTTTSPPILHHQHHKDLNPEELKMAPPEAITTLPRVSIIEPQLDCGVSKSRVKGPPGRRLPRSKKSIDTLLDEDQSESSVIFRDDRGRATSLSALEHSKDSVDLRPEPRRRGEKHLGKTNMKTNHELRLGSKRTTAAVVDLTYHYTSSEEDDALDSSARQGHTLRTSKCQDLDRLSLDRTKPVPGPQVKVGTPSSLKLTRRNGPGIRGGTPVRYSASMTPPPCLLRKFRQEGTADQRLGRDKYPRDDPCDWSSSNEGRQSCRSSRSSLSTLTDDHVPPIGTTQPGDGGGADEHEITKPTNQFHHHENKSYDTYASLKRKFQTPSRLTSPQISNRMENGCCNRRLPQSVTSSPVANGRCHSTLERTIEMLKRDSWAIGNGGVAQGHGAEVHSGELSEIENLRSTVEILRDKVNRLSAPFSNAGKQISTAIKEANDLRAEALNICEYAKTAKMTLEKLTEETENVLEWLRKMMPCQSQKICSCCPPAAPLQFDLCCSSASQKFQRCPSPGSLCKGNEIENSLERSVESPSSIAVPHSFAQKQVRRHHRQRSADSESSEPTSSDNETKSVVHKSIYHKS